MAFKSKERDEGLNIIIVGCGKVGIAILRQLCKEGHDITIVDKNQQKIQTYANLYDVMGVVGNGASHSVQMEAGIENADLIIAVTDSDELNILCCTIAKQVGNCAAIARVHDPDYSSETSYLCEKLGLTMIINPELETAKEISRILNLPTALEVSSFARGQVEMIKIRLPENNMLDGMAVMDVGRRIISKNKDAKVLLGAIERAGKVYIPDGSFILRAGDIVSIVSTSKNGKAFLDAIGFKTNRVKDTLIVGGGDVAYYLAQILINSGIDVKIIEVNKNRCEELSVLLPKATIICGDGTDEELLKEEGLDHTGSFVPLTGIDEENIFLTLHTRHMSNAKVITKINRSNFKDVINTLNLDSVLYPSLITSEAIIAYVRAKKNSMHSDIETLYHMFDSRAEAIEFSIDAESSVTGVSLKDLKLKKNLLIAFINRNGDIILPNGFDTINVGDTVMVVTTDTGLNDINDILK